MIELLLTTLQLLKPLVALWMTWWLIKRLWHEYHLASKDPTCDAPLPPGSMGLPIVGETLAFLSTGSKFYEDKFRVYGRLFLTHLLGNPTVRVRGSDNLHRILHGEEDIVSFQYPGATTNILGKHTLVQARGQHHVTLRKRVASAFSLSALEGYLPLITEPIKDAVDRLCSQPRTITHRAMRDLVCKVNGSVLCGFTYSDEEIAEMSQLIADVDDGILAIPIDLPGTAYRKGIEAGVKIRAKIADSIRNKERLSSGEDRQDCLRNLMDADISCYGEGVSHHEVVADNAFDLLVLGFGTLSSACTSVVLQLYRHPDIIEKIREELDSIGILDPNVPILQKSLGRCSYVSYVVKEVLRVAPPVPASFRKVIKTFILDGMQIPAGWMILYSIKDTLTFSEHYKNQEKFDPDRFGPDRREDKNGGRYNYPVFGGGQRVCPGQVFARTVLQILIIELVRSTRWELLEPDNVKIRSIPVPHPVDGLPAKFTRIGCDGSGQGTDENNNTVRPRQGALCGEGGSG